MILKWACFERLTGTVLKTFDLTVLFYKISLYPHIAYLSDNF
jgi:predicted transcriptional regulator with HTH domain